MQRQKSLEQACLCARTCENMRGVDTLVLEVGHITPLFEFFIISSATNPRQMRAMLDETKQVLKAAGSNFYGREGEESATWAVQDFGDIVLHVFSPDARALYDLEHLWGDAIRIDWKAECAQ